MLYENDSFAGRPPPCGKANGAETRSTSRCLSAMKGQCLRWSAEDAIAQNGWQAKAPAPPKRHPFLLCRENFDQRVNRRREEVAASGRNHPFGPERHGLRRIAFRRQINRALASRAASVLADDNIEAAVLRSRRSVDPMIGQEFEL